MIEPARLVAAAFAVGVLVSGCGDDSSSPSTSSTTTTTAPQSGNLLPNADFAKGTQGWRSHVTDGTSLRFRAAAGGGALDIAGRHEAAIAGLVEAQANPLPAKAGAIYRLRSTLRVSDPTKRRGARQRVIWLTRSGRQVEVTLGRTVPAKRPGSLRLDDRFTAPRGAERMVVLIGIVVVGHDRVSFSLSDPELTAA